MEYGAIGAGFLCWLSQVDVYRDERATCLAFEFSRLDASQREL
jgi:hypothetical protein